MSGRHPYRIYSAAELHLIPEPEPCKCNGVRVTNPAVWPQGDDPAIKRLLQSAPRPRCSFCRGPLQTLKDSHFELFDGPTLRYPQEPENLLAAYCHTHCGPDTAYHFTFARLLQDGVDSNPRSWYSHLREKQWFCESFIDELEEAFAAASIVAKLQQPTADRPRDARAAVTAKVRLEIFARDGHRCRACGAPPPLELDHIMPVSKGGSADPANLQALCVACNRAKRDRVLTGTR